MRLENKQIREFYLKESSEQNWSVRTLERNIKALYYQRILSVQSEVKQINAESNNLNDFVKDPYILEFLNITNESKYSEAEFESLIITHLQKFLMELGKGFSFVGRQYRISTETEHYYIDLVFYNYLLKCFVLIDLKIGKLTHQDIGQMDMYRRMFDDLKKPEGDNPTIGIILCSEKSETVVKYSIMNENKHIFASKYLPYLPTEQELIEEIEREKRNMSISGKSENSENIY
jgi:predicted nuclease of restriction endonuclease-like (RecB) superfamily